MDGLEEQMLSIIKNENTNNEADQEEVDIQKLFAQSNIEILIENKPITEQENILDEMATRQMEEYKTLMKKKTEAKNIPKIFGNYFYRFCKLSKQKNLNPQLPLGVIDFLKRKNPAKQSTYGLEDFRNLCQGSAESKSLFYHYITNFLYLDLLHSNKIRDPQEYINFIEQYAAGANQPELFISNIKFPQLSKKIIKKRQNAKRVKK